MVRLRVARAEDREEAPLHYEGLGLASRWRAAGAAGGGAATVAGVGIMVRLAGTGTDVLGAVMAAVGVVVLVGLARCRRAETVVGRRWLRWRCGPFREELPTSLITGGEVRAATGWRRLYGPHEVVLGLSSGQSGPTLPSAEPAELLRILRDEL